MHTKSLMVALLAGTFLMLTAAAQENVWQGSQNGPMLKAQLLDRNKNAQHRLAVVDVDVKGVVLTDPTSYEYSMPGEAHVQFRLDGGPYVLPMNNRVAFEGLTPGKHTIEVTLADNSYRPLGPKVTLDITIP